jgi:CheY-like chemotaxis protein
LQRADFAAHSFNKGFFDVSLRILFADDSMTAQNMGKKILSEAGYDVVAVSNGAAAVKKIAEQKPDIIILDVYMPGYTGLEVCEKVRGSIDTLKTPVLLTVGKLEPYKPEDANRVKADGVIIKPFEASDLLAIVKKFEERIGSAPQLAQQPVLEERKYEEEAPVEAPVEAQPASNRASMQPMVEVPDHMAGAAAFGDLLGSEPAPAPSASHFAVNTPSAAFETSVIVPAPPIVADYGTAAPAKEEEKIEPVIAEPAQPSPEAVAPELDASPEVTVAPVEMAPEPAPAPEAPAAQPETVAEAPHPQFIPVFKEPEAPARYDFMPTATPAIDDVEIPREPALQETAEETTRSTVADQVEPGLMTSIGEQVNAFPTRWEGAPSANAAEVNSAAGEPVSAPSTQAPAEVSDADFEARVAAAMAAYSHATESEPVRAPAVEEPAPAVETHDVPFEHSAPAEVPSFEYHPPVQGAEPAPAAEIAHEEPVAHTEAPATGDHATAVAGVEAATSEIAAAVAGGVEPEADHHQTIAQAVHRVMERLKPELVEEIMRELKSKK